MIVHDALQVNTAAEICGDSAPTFPNAGGMFQNILVASIQPDPEQPRQFFDGVALAELARSIQHNGLAVPVLVRPTGNGFMLVHGERRLRAVQSLGWETIPAEIRNLEPEEARRLALIENVQRQDLSPTEEARAFRKLLDSGLSQASLGEQLGKSQSYIAQKLRLLSLPDFLSILIDRCALTENHCRQLLKLRGWFCGLSQDGDPPSSEKSKEFIEIWDKFEPWERVIWLSLSFRPMAGFGAIIPKLHIETCQESSWIFISKMLRGENIELWEFSAYYFAMAASGYGLSVVELSKNLDSFHECILSHVSYWLTHKDRTVDANSYHGRLLEWVNDDLSLCRLSHFLEQDGIPLALRKEAMTYVLKHNGYVLPSSIQPWSILKDARALWEEMQKPEGFWEAQA